MDIVKGIERRFRYILDKILDREWPSDETVLKVFGNRDDEAIIRRIKKKNKINVAFFCMSVSLWKYDTIFQMMQKDPFFHPLFFISPRKDSYRVRRKEIKMMIDFCRKKGYEYVNMRSNLYYLGQKINNYDIDVAFYSQPYSNISPRSYYYDKLCAALLCYVPYGYLISKMEHNYVSLLNQIAWKVYMPTSVTKYTASLFCKDTSNMEDVGYPGYDMYLNSESYNWKKTGLKKIIWAPHFSIRSNSWLHLSSFLFIYREMVEIAKKYKNEALFVFKPHPHLYPALCAEWGVKQTNDYYSLWSNMENTVLVEGNGYPVFKSSDALIHDCASYLLDYMYTQKPCLYVSLSGKLNVETAEDGMDAYEAHYHAKSSEDIDSFIQHVVIGGEDNMQGQRKDVLKKHILPKTGRSATENIIGSIKAIL